MHRSSLDPDECLVRIHFDTIMIENLDAQMPTMRTIMKQRQSHGCVGSHFFALDAGTSNERLNWLPLIFRIKYSSPDPSHAPWSGIPQPKTPFRHACTPASPISPLKFGAFGASLRENPPMTTEIQTNPL